MSDANDDSDDTDDGSRSDLATSQAPGGLGQVEQSPARGHRAAHEHTARPDPAIRERIAAWLAGRDELAAERVQVLVDSGIVALLGEAPDYESKRHLEEFVLTVPGVREVHDQLLVRGDAPYAGAGGLRTDAPGGRSDR